MVSRFKELLHWSGKQAHYMLCLTVFVLSITTVGNFQVFVSKQSLNRWDDESSVLYRFLWNILLLVSFVVQHSLMATQWWKDLLASRLGVTVSQRLLYNVASSITLLLCIIKWQSIPEIGLWMLDMSDHWLLSLAFYLLHSAAWFLWYLQVFLMDPGEMLGVSQVLCYYKGQPHPLTGTKANQKVLDLYSRLRHPGPLLVTILLWIHPLMTLDRLLLACWCTSYLSARHSTTDIHYKTAEKHFQGTLSHNRRSTVTFQVHED